MSIFRKFLAVALAASFFLSSCQQSPGTASPAPASSPSPSSTTQPATLLPYSSPLPSFTPTSPPCDPATTLFCIQSGTFFFQPPIAPPGVFQVDRSYPYGSTSGGRLSPHHGVEFYNASGTPVLAAADGRVLVAGTDHETLFGPWSDFYGNLIIIEHMLPGPTIYTLYGHLSTLLVSPGQQVTAGQLIGEVGATGWATGSHLHFEVRTQPGAYASTLNPELFLIPAPGTGVLSLRFIATFGQFTAVSANVQFFSDPSGGYTQAWQPEPYPPETLLSPAWENALLGALPAGRYRISFLWQGTLFERWVEIQPGMLTQVEFLVE